MKATKTTTTQEEVSSSGSGFPSADLIKYRFDTIDKTLAKLDTKLETMNGQIVTPKDMADAKIEAVAQHLELQKQIDAIRTSAKWWVGVLLTVIPAAVGIIALVLK